MIYLILGWVRWPLSPKITKMTFYFGPSHVKNPIFSVRSLLQETTKNVSNERLVITARIITIVIFIIYFKFLTWLHVLFSHVLAFYYPPPALASCPFFYKLFFVILTCECTVVKALRFFYFLLATCTLEMSVCSEAKNINCKSFGF